MERSDPAVAKAGTLLVETGEGQFWVDHNADGIVLVRVETKHAGTLRWALPYMHARRLAEALRPPIPAPTAPAKAEVPPAHATTVTDAAWLLVRNFFDDGSPSLPYRREEGATAHRSSTLGKAYALLMALEAVHEVPAALEWRRNAAAYLLDRADQYNTESPCWVALSDAAANIARGVAEDAAAHGEFDDAIYERVARIAGPLPPPAATDPLEVNQNARNQDR